MKDKFDSVESNRLKIAVIVGTSRPGRQSIHAARLVYQIAGEFDQVEPIWVDPADFDLPGDGDNQETKDPRYSRITKQADGFFIITPEYNHSYPGSLKRMLDSEYQNNRYKPVALAGVSVGPWGGVRAIESLLPVIKTMGMIPLRLDAYFPQVDQVFNDQGQLLDDKYCDRLRRVFKELIWMTEVMKSARANRLTSSD